MKKIKTGGKMTDKEIAKIMNISEDKVKEYRDKNFDVNRVAEFLKVYVNEEDK